MVQCKKEHIIFDLDGTLIDSDSTVIKIINEIRVENDLMVLSDEQIRPFLSVGGEELISKTVTNSKIKDSNKHFLSILREKYRKIKVNTDILYPNVIFSLKQFRKDNCNIYLCTNKANFLARKILTELGIKQYFTKIVGDGDLKTRKPHPDNFNACIQGHTADLSSCVVIGDSIIDLQLSLDVGVSFCAYNNGFNKSFIADSSSVYFSDYVNLTSDFLNEQFG